MPMMCKLTRLILYNQRPIDRWSSAIMTISLPIRRRCRFGRLSASVEAITYSSMLLSITPLLILLMRHGSPPTRRPLLLLVHDASSTSTTGQSAQRVNRQPTSIQIPFIGVFLIRYSYPSLAEIC